MSSYVKLFKLSYVLFFLNSSCRFVDNHTENISKIAKLISTAGEMKNGSRSIISSSCC